MENNYLTGKIKFYNKDKGFGFIYCETKKQDYYFNIKNINNGDIPNENDVVTFKTIDNPKGISAVDITITSKADLDKSSKDDSRVTCNKCGKKMVPRIVFKNGIAVYSVCPFCGKKYKTFTIYYIILFINIVIFIIFLIVILSMNGFF